MNHVLRDIKEEINTVIITDFNTSLTLMGISSIQKIKERVTLNDILDQMKLTSYLLNILSKNSRMHLFSSARRAFSRIDLILGHKTSL